MRKTILLIFISIILSNFMYAQEFSFLLTVTDASGNSDSVSLGYDSLGTSYIDSLFNETDISTIPYNSNIDVRTSNMWMTPNFYGLPWPGTATPIQSKIQIWNTPCFAGVFSTFPSKLVEVDIKTSNWPVMITWNHTLFNDPCRVGSLFTCHYPGGWWDVGGCQRTILISTDSDYYGKSDYYSINGNDTAYAFWVAISDSNLLTLGIHELSNNSQAQINPNPFLTSTTLSFKNNLKQKVTVSIFGVMGNLIETQETNASFFILNRGTKTNSVYFYQLLFDETKKVERGKFVIGG